MSFRPLPTFTPQPGSCWSGVGTAFKCPRCHLRCTLLAIWQQGTAEPWFILTDLPAQMSDAAWYGLRMWIEHGFKTTKRGGWQWQYTRMVDPERAEHLWLAITTATLWLLSVGGEGDPSLPHQSLS